MRDRQLGIIIIFVVFVAGAILVPGYSNGDTDVTNKAKINSFEIISHGCEENLSKDSSANIGTPTTFTGIIWVDSSEQEIIYNIDKHTSGAYKIHINSSSNGGSQSTDTKCSGRYGVHYSVAAEIPFSNQDGTIVLLYENGNREGCVSATHQDTPRC